jgi:hypothetical protein
MYTEEDIYIVRLLIGDTPQSVFYPLLEDADIVALLTLEDGNVLRTARRAAITAAFLMSTQNYRERCSDIEVWNNASIEYRKVLEAFIKETGQTNLPPHLKPYAAGISIADVNAANNNPDRNRSPLSQISPCIAWWTRVNKYPSDLIDYIRN